MGVARNAVSAILIASILASPTAVAADPGAPPATAPGAATQVAPPSPAAGGSAGSSPEGSGLRAPGPEAAGESGAAVERSTVVEPERGGVLELDGLRIELPPGAVSAATRISVRRLAAVEDTGEGLSNVTAGARGYRFEPHGLRFQRAIVLRLPFDRRLLASEVGLSSLYTYFYDEANCRWERLRRLGIDRETATVASETTHFTDMINAALRLPEAPSPIQFDPNSIKSLAAAKPDAEVPMPSGPEPGPFGSNSFSIPLRLPPGRGGAAPELSLRYSSDSQGGWLGRGFDIEVPAVTIDTRFGLPGYAGEDLYSFGGEELERFSSFGPSTFYRPRVERAFRQIRWVRSGGEDYWEVSDKDGTVGEYGRGEGWVGPDRNDRSRTFAWYLTKRRDAFGNTVVYDYEYDSANACTYLASIRYSGFETAAATEAGLFRVVFVGEDRADRRIDSRGGFPSKLARRLARIDVYASGAKVRGYRFDYGDYNEFGQSQLRALTETDGSGLPFYAYRFEYYSLERHPDASGAASFDGFGSSSEKADEVETWSVGREGKYDGLSSSMTASVNGSLSLGCAFYLPKIWRPGRKKKGELSIRGGIGASIGGSLGAFVDANGDGLPDLVWREGGSLRAYLNTGSGFDSSSEFRLGGISSVLDKESSYGISYGATARLGRIGGGVSRQESWSSCETSFADVNGDGLPDFVKEGDSEFDENTGAGFEPRRWVFGPPSPPGEAADLDESAYGDMYYSEDPVRAWQSWRSGVVEVAMRDAELLDPGRTGKVVLCSYAPGSQTDPSSWIDLPGPGQAPTRQYALGASERLFFRVDPRGDERRAAVSWGIAIRYVSIRLFEPLAEASELRPVRSYPESEGPCLGALARIYKFDAASRTYGLDGSWRDRADEDVCQALAARGRFVPRRVAARHFAPMLEAAKAAQDAGGAPGADEGEEEGEEFPRGTSDYQMLLMGFGYEPETDSFLLQEPSGCADEETRDFVAGNAAAIGEAFMRYVSIPTIGDDDRVRMAASAAVDREGASVWPTRDASGALGYVRSVFLGLEPRILPSASAPDAVDGCQVEGSGFLLERRSGPLDGEPEALWYRPGEGVYREAGGEWTECPAASTSATAEGGSLELRLSDYRVPRTFRFSDPSYLLTSIPESVYASKLRRHFLDGRSFSLDAFWRLSADAYREIAGGLSPEAGLPLDPASEPVSDREFFQSVYVPDPDGGYRLSGSLGSGDLGRLLGLLRTRSSPPSSPLCSLPGDPSLRFLGLDAADVDSFLGAEGEDLAGDFAFADGFYYQKAELEPAARLRLLDAMGRYYCEKIAFPYYAHDPAADSWRLETSLSEADLKAVESTSRSCGLWAYTRLTKSISYRSDQSLDVAPAKLPPDAGVVPIAPGHGSGAGAGAEAPVGVAIVPVLRPGGETVLEPRYIRTYDSERDFSDLDLTTYSSTAQGGGRREARAAYFQGGVEGWYYGLWTGNYPWDAAKLGKLPDQGGRDIEGGEVAAPPYSSKVKANALGDGSLLIAASGRDDRVEVPAEAWVGEVSSYGAATLADDLTATTTTYDFAAFMDGLHWHPGRSGGDSYYRIPAKGGAVGEGGSLPFIRESHSRGKDTNYPAGISRNEGDSWQYCGLMDMNGDRFPDLVKFRDSRGGASSFAVVEGNGRGFGPEKSYVLPSQGWLNRSENSAWCVGASPSAALGAIGVVVNPRGRLARTEPQQDGSSPSLALSASFGSSVQVAGFYDMNGDGLPDYVERRGGDGYGVALNRGDGSFCPVDWGQSRIGVDAFDGLGGIGSIPLQGLSHSATGSLGGSVGASVWEASLSAGLSGSSSRTISGLVDANGDGLPDVVVKKAGESFFRVLFNLGDRFSDAETRIYRPDWPDEVSRYELDVARELRQLLGGLNGIGLLGHDISGSIPDLGRFPVPRANDNPFGVAINPLQVDDDLEYSAGASLSLGVNVDFSFDLFFIKWFIEPGVGGSLARTGVDLKFADVDGDGLPDHALKMPRSTRVLVKRNLMGKVGLIERLLLPQGGSYAFDYRRAGNTRDMPQSRWTLASLVVSDGMAGTCSDRGERSYAESYEYSGGVYDRLERTFYGFGAVAATRGDGSVSTTEYFNDDYSTRGMARRAELRGGCASGRGPLFEETSKVVEKILVPGSYGKLVYFPAAVAETTRRYEAGTQRFQETTTRYEFEPAYGNLVRLVDLGAADDPDDDLVAAISYARGLPGYLRAHPSCVEVADSRGHLLRRRRGEYGSRGELASLREYDGESSFLERDIGYDEYGNLASLTDGRGYRLSWSFGDPSHAYPTRIARDNPWLGAPAYESLAEWDTAFGKRLRETDENGQSTRYRYDSFGRLVEARSPYDSGAVPAVECRYSSAVFPWSATTENKLLYDPEDGRTIATSVSVDGLGRVSQTAKRGEYRDGGGSRRRGWNLSGAVAYDAKGRACAAGQESFAEGEASPGLAGMLRPTVTAYDALDRVVSVLLPDGALERTEYLVEGSTPVERKVDPLLNVVESGFDGRGNVVYQRRISRSGAVLSTASFKYDGLGELLSAADGRSNAVEASYDLLGRRTKLSSPDSGEVLLAYDGAGNLSRKTDSALRGRGEAIAYEYDAFERLVKVQYPRSAVAEYSFGAPGAAAGGAGRLVERRDSSGSLRFEYGLLGETTAISRSLRRLTPLAGDLSARFELGWDYLGRTQWIAYPDGEVLSYAYDSGGRVSGAKSSHNGLDTAYVEDIAYDPSGRRTFVEYGNGVRTAYSYDPDRRWLSALRTIGRSSERYQDMVYRFDLAGNVLGYQNAASGYETSQAYGYDDLYQLTEARGTSVYRPIGLKEYSSEYSQSFAYDSIGNLTAKSSRCLTVPSRTLGDDLDYELPYRYRAGRAHQADSVGNRYYRYDQNGNMMEEREGGHGSGEVLAGTVYQSGGVRMTDTGFGIVRQDGAPGASREEAYCRTFAWDEENRLVRSADNRTWVDYRYDADGRRTAKRSPGGESLYFDAMWAVTTDGPELRQMKNVYIGEDRVATRLTIAGEDTTGYERQNTYYFHADHLGSAQFVTDYRGGEFERIEYTPYGETWIEKGADSLGLLPYKFAGEELDSETGLYYYGARYLNPKISGWISPDPALGDYLPRAPLDEGARRYNRNLPGLGGVFNSLNLSLYRYAGNNPVKYKDPDGRIFAHYANSYLQNDERWRTDPYGKQPNETLGNSGCNLTAAVNNVNTMTGADITPPEANTATYVDAAGNFNYMAFYSDNGLGYARHDVDPKSIEGLLCYYDQAKTTFAVSARVPYLVGNNEDTHVVNIIGIMKDAKGEMWAKIDPTSISDKKLAARKRDDWEFEMIGGTVVNAYVKASSITSLQSGWKE